MEKKEEKMSTNGLEYVNLLIVPVEDLIQFLYYNERERERVKNERERERKCE